MLCKRDFHSEDELGECRHTLCVVHTDTVLPLS
jgi:hypothetical protein